LSSQTEILLPSTTPATQPNNDLDNLDRTGVPSRLDETAAALELRLQREVDARKEERFYWICGLTILADVIFFKFLESTFAWSVIVTIELPILIGLAGWLGVDHVAVFLEKVFHKYLKEEKSETK